MFGVRPDDIFHTKLTNLISATPENTIKATVDVIEPMGPTVTVYLDVAGNNVVATVDAETKIKEDTEVELVLDMAKTHVFDKASEVAVY